MRGPLRLSTSHVILTNRLRAWTVRRQRPSLVATEGDEMQVTASMMTLEFSGHEENNIPTLSEKLERVGHAHLVTSR